MCTDCTKHASAGALIHRQQKIYWIFTRPKPSRIYSRKLIGPGWNIKCCLQFRQNANFTTFRWWQEEGNFEVLKRCNIQIFPTSFLPCYGKAVNLQHMWNLEWSNVELFSFNSFGSYVKYTPSALIGSLGHLMPNGCALFTFDEPIHIPSVFVLLILDRKSVV